MKLSAGRSSVWLMVGLAVCGALGAAEEGHEEAPLADYDRDHWSFQPVVRPNLPGVEDARWPRSPIDRFLLAALEARDLRPMPEADRGTLLRRITFDLTGLPPTPDELAAFLADDEPGAWERVVDRLLASPAYGERWAQHWLDLARFAETDGFEHDHVRPEAWRYRDWLIGALNEDLPYDRFIALQIAADELAPDDPNAQLATGFLLAGPDMPDINSQAERRHSFLNGMTANVGETLLGLQFGCCQCHDHKADPLSQYDFYRLRAFFEPIDLFRDQPLAGAEAGDDASEGKARIVRNRRRDAPEARLWVRGDFRRPGPIVAASFPRVAVPAEANPRVESAHPRAELARWLGDTANPLTARVIVNRVWQHHFGQGLVGTPSDFGLMGYAPSHPELLDWLASELIRQEWSLKGLHREIVTSAAYRAVSRPDDSTDSDRWQALTTADPDNELLGRMNRRRLEGEAIRDAMLAAAGTLNPAAGGPGVRPPLPAEVTKTLLKNHWPTTKDEGEHTRRSIYLFSRRNLRLPLFEVFDKPDANLSCPRRSETTIAPQALHLLNSEFALQAARAIAQRVLAEETDDGARIDRCWLLTLARAPTPAERAAALAFLHEGGASAWNDLCLGLVNLNEFVYVD